MFDLSHWTYGALSFLERSSDYNLVLGNVIKLNILEGTEFDDNPNLSVRLMIVWLLLGVELTMMRLSPGTGSCSMVLAKLAEEMPCILIAHCCSNLIH